MKFSTALPAFGLFSATMASVIPEIGSFGVPAEGQGLPGDNLSPEVPKVPGSDAPTSEFPGFPKVPAIPPTPQVGDFAVPGFSGLPTKRDIPADAVNLQQTSTSLKTRRKHREQDHNKGGKDASPGNFRRAPKSAIDVLLELKANLAGILVQIGAKAQARTGSNIGKSAKVDNSLIDIQVDISALVTDVLSAAAKVKVIAPAVPGSVASREVANAMPKEVSNEIIAILLAISGQLNLAIKAFGVVVLKDPIGKLNVAIAGLLIDLKVSIPGLDVILDAALHKNMPKFGESLADLHA